MCRKYQNPDAYVMASLEEAENNVIKITLQRDELAAENRALRDKLNLITNVLKPKANRFGASENSVSVDLDGIGTYIMKAGNSARFDMLAEAFDLHVPTVAEWNGFKAACEAARDEETCPSYNAPEPAQEGAEATEESEADK